MIFKAALAAARRAVDASIMKPRDAVIGVFDLPHR